jgi:hypothetical protein
MKFTTFTSSQTVENIGYLREHCGEHVNFEREVHVKVHREICL